MSYQERKEIIQEISKIRGNPLICYVTSSRPNMGATIASDIIPYFIEQFQSIDQKHNEIDVFLKSSGGDGLTVWRIISYARQKFAKVNVLIPYEAFSAATIFSLGCDEIVMGSFGNLGPIDPQITVKDGNGNEQNFAYEDVVSFFDFVKENIGSDNDIIKETLNIIAKDTNPIGLGFARRASALSEEYAEKLLCLKGETQDKAKEIAKKLNKTFFNHGHAVSKKEAKNIGLNIIDPSDELEKLIWRLHLNYQDELKEKEGFDPIQEFMRNEGVVANLKELDKIFALPNEILQQLLQQKDASEIFNNNLQRIQVNNIRAVIESETHVYQFHTLLEITAKRSLDLSFQLNVSTLFSGRKLIT